MLGLARLNPRVYLSKETERQADGGCTHPPEYPDIGPKAISLTRLKRHSQQAQQY